MVSDPDDAKAFLGCLLQHRRRTTMVVLTASRVHRGVGSLV